MIVDRNLKLIAAIIKHGKGVEVVDRLVQEKGIAECNVTSGRGRGAAHRGNYGVWDEVDTIAAIVPAERADEIFEFIYEAGDVARPKGGIVFQHPITVSTRLDLSQETPRQ